MTAKSKRARRLLAGEGVARENSDDELGTDERTWEWITSDKANEIVGARFGDFQCHLGDCVLVKAESAKEAWVAIVCEFKDGQDTEKLANFMWFSTDREIRNKSKKRHDVMENELFITASFDWNPLVTINGSARVMSPQALLKEFPTGKVPAKSKHRGKVFLCRRGCNTRTATYTPEFEWEQIYRGFEDIRSLIDRVKAQTKVTRQKHHESRYRGDAQIAPTQTPTLKARGVFTGKNTRKSPESVGYRIREPLSGDARINQKRLLEFAPLGTRRQVNCAPVESPYQAVRDRLHLSCVPPALPCREAAFNFVFSHLEAAIIEGTGSCIYISGTPGTGKTATVREVIAQMNAAVEADELDDFMFVEINGMKITDPHQSYALLWEAIHGDRISPSHALALLNAEFGKPSPRRIPCVVLMDELDQLATKNQSVMYNFFNWPSLPHSRLIVLAVANTMDLPERTLSNKISSRLGLIRITFPGYTYDQLMKIIQSRLDGIAEGIFDPDAIQFASRKVAAVSGDARRALEICRRAVEIAETRARGDVPAENPATTPTEGLRLEEQVTRVSIDTIKAAIKEATSNPFQQLVKNLPWTSRVLLNALVQRATRNGTSESILLDVVAEARRHVHLTNGLAHKGPKSPLFKHVRQGQSGGQPDFTSSSTEALEVGLAGLVEAGVVEVEAKRRDRVSRIRLAVRTDDVTLALKNDEELQSRGVLI